MGPFAQVILVSTTVDYKTSPYDWEHPLLCLQYDASLGSSAISSRASNLSRLVGAYDRVKHEAFCRLMASGQCKNQSDVYHKAFHCPNAKPTTVKVRASELIAKRNIRVTLQALSAPIDRKVRKTREELLNLLEDLTYFDPRKMVDSQGHLLPIHDLPFAERMALAAYEIVEASTRVNRATGSPDAVLIGVRTKVKFVDRFKCAVTYAKMRGFLTDEPPADPDKALKSLTVVFVNSKGEPVEVDLNPRPTLIPVVEDDSPPMGMKLVR